MNFCCFYEKENSDLKFKKVFNMKRRQKSERKILSKTKYAKSAKFNKNDSKNLISKKLTKYEKH